MQYYQNNMLENNEYFYEYNFIISSFQTRNTEHNFFLINLIVSESALTVLGMPIDVYNGITLGVGLICPIVGFIHTFFGECVYLVLISISCAYQAFELSTENVVIIGLYIYINKNIYWGLQISRQKYY